MKGFEPDFCNKSENNSSIEESEFDRSRSKCSRGRRGRSNERSGSFSLSNESRLKSERDSEDSSVVGFPNDRNH